MRRLAERLLRNASLRRRLPSGAVIWVSPDSQLKYLRREFDRDLVRLAKDHTGPGSVVWDIGANCGVFAFSATQAKSVVAVEADPFLCHLLQRSVLANDPSNVTVLPGAISEAVGIAEFAIASRGRASNFLVQHGGRSQSGGRRGTLLVPTITLDTMLEKLSPPTFVKIDVEGTEASVLRGASRLLSDIRPTFYIEVGQDSEDECRRLFDQAGYTLTGDRNWLAQPR
jgi:FkbM family methyltransferase